ncbi:MAG TPA: GNAT family N-acetyltransferase [bacterium]|nr:GNAT family N-acetyltransferase [bacterium]
MISAPQPIVRQVTFTVETVTDFPSFLALEAEWSDLERRARSEHPFVGHAWVRTWLETVGAGRGIRMRVIRHGGKCVGIVPLVTGRERLRGVPVGSLKLAGDEHTPRFDLLIDPAVRREALTALVDHLQADESWDVVVLPEIPADSPTLALLPAIAAAAGLGADTWKSGASPVLPLSGSWESCLETLSTRHRANMRSRWRHLERQGSLAVETVAGGEGLAAAVSDGLRLEGVAWKREAGTAIECDPERVRFYARLAERAAEAGWLRLFFLVSNGKRIAFFFCLRFANRLYLLKQGYDADFARDSPAILLCRELIERSFRDRLDAVDFLGDAEPWKLEWTEVLRQQHWLFLFGRGHRARLAQFLKFGLRSS